nr:MAG TPA: hypothetical protein [Caudoviricetes sp.]
MHSPSGCLVKCIICHTNIFVNLKPPCSTKARRQAPE